MEGNSWPQVCSHCQCGGHYGDKDGQSGHFLSRQEEDGGGAGIIGSGRARKSFSGEKKKKLDRVLEVELYIFALLSKLAAGALPLGPPLLQTRKFLSFPWPTPQHLR